MRPGVVAVLGCCTDPPFGRPRSASGAVRNCLLCTLSAHGSRSWCLLSGYEFLTSPHAASEPGPGDGAGAFCSDVVAALSHLAQMLD
jgi:hypothetical protein